MPLWSASIPAKNIRPRVNTALVLAYILPYMAKSTASTPMFTKLTAALMSISIVIATGKRDRLVLFTFFQICSGPLFFFFLNRCIELVNCLVIVFQVVCSEVNHAVLFTRFRDHVVLFKHAYVVLNGLVIKPHHLGEVVHVVRLLLEEVDNPYPVLAAPRACEEEPEQAPGVGIGHPYLAHLQRI